MSVFSDIKIKPMDENEWLCSHPKAEKYSALDRDNESQVACIYYYDKESNEIFISIMEDTSS